MFSENVLGDGGCLFTSLSISLKCKRLLTSMKCMKPIETQENKLEYLLKESAENGFQIRQAIIHWYIVHLEKDIKELGTLQVLKKQENDEKNTQEEGFKAKDVLLLELARQTELPDNEKLKMSLVLNYLKEMTLFHSWGSTPEYLAFSLLFKYPIKVWRVENNELVLNDEFPPSSCEDSDIKKQKCVHLLFINGNHYEPLITEKERQELIDLYGGSMPNFSKYHKIKII